MNQELQLQRADSKEEEVKEDLKARVIQELQGYRMAKEIQEQQEHQK
jgi:hypothetical protein